MRLAATNIEPQGHLSISDVAPRFGSTKLSTALTLVVLSTLLLIVCPAQGQTETVLYHFTGGSDGNGPECGLSSDGKGNFYGTTGSGGIGFGTVFELSPNGNGGWNETVLHSFTGGVDGSTPYFTYVILDSAGNLYGTASGGGANGQGVVFELSPIAGSWVETVLYSFRGSADGGDPENGLVRDSTGNLYGRNSAGVFELSPSGGGWTEQVIYRFEGGNNDGLSMDASGNIFGVSYSSVFELSPNGNGGWNQAVIHTFTGYPQDGIDPESAPVPDNAGNLYGTTISGGAFGKKHGGYGVVYKLSLGGEGWTEKIIYSFKGGPKDGNGPWAAVVLDAARNIYGTTILGGAHHSAGTVFELVAPLGSGSYQEKVLWNFDITDGDNPVGSLIQDSAGSLYGTTVGGNPQQGQGCGGFGCGVVFEVTP